MDDQAAEELVARFGAQVAAQALTWFEQLLDWMRQGVPVADAIWQCQAGFTGWYSAGLADAFGELLRQRVEVQRVLAMPVGGIALSQRLYAHNQDTAARVQAIVKEHAQGLHQARELALQLYDGYVPTDTAKRPLEGRARAELPKALRQLMQNHQARQGLEDVLDEARRRASGLKTKALRAAYSEFLDAWAAGAAEEALRERLGVAVREKNRYMASRIAHSELARAHEARKGQQFMADDEVEVVQVMLNPAHPVMDICDLHASADLWGLGPGLYPKAKAPQPTFHPWCWCHLRARRSLSAAQAREVENGAGAYLRGLTPEQAAQVMGGPGRAQEVLNGGSVDEVLNRGQNPLYHLRRLGDAGSGHALVAENAAMHNTGPQIVSGLIDAAQQATDSPAQRLEALWANPAKFAKHVDKRLRNADVSSVEDYAAQTFATLAAAQRITVAQPADGQMHGTGKVQVVVGGWVVLLSEQGRIVTAYPFDANMVQFEERHRSMGDQVYDYRITEESQRLLARLFA